VAPAGGIPSEIQLRRGSQRASIRRAGATLRSYRSHGRELLDGFGSDEWSQDGRGQLLLPWPNRIRGGRYRFGGRHHQLAITEVDRNNAIHGLVRWVTWQVEEAEPERARLSVELSPRPGYPFWMRFEAEYCLTTEGLAVMVEARNLGRGPAPFGAGAHPYVRLAGRRVDDLLLRIPSGRRLTADDQGIPAGEVDVEGTKYDFREARRIGPMRLDTCFSDLPRDGWEVELGLGPGLDGARVWADRAFPYVMVYSGDGVTPAGRRRTGLAVEPMTCAPDAFNSRLGLLTLGPGETFRGRWGLSHGG
jgi:galactose mutarotase-like enzyme